MEKLFLSHVLEMQLSPLVSVFAQQPSILPLMSMTTETQHADLVTLTLITKEISTVLNALGTSLDSMNARNVILLIISQKTENV